MAISNCREYVFPRLTRESTLLTNAVFHPTDDSQGSHDIALYEVTPINEAPQSTNALPIPIEALSCERSVPAGTAVVISGYSVAYLDKHFDPTSNRFLPPEHTRSHVRDAPLHLLRISGFSRALRDIRFIQTENGEAVGEGASGGPVFRESDHVCIGMLVASVDASWTFPSGQVVLAKGGAFIPAVYIREAIERA